MVEEVADFVAGDFNGTSCGRKVGDEHNLHSILEEAFLSHGTWPHPVVGPSGIPHEWTDVCGFLKAPRS